MPLHHVVTPFVGQPLWDFENPGHFVRALIAIVKCIDALQMHGILHRKIAIGSVLLSGNRREGHEAFLTDLDLARVDVVHNFPVWADRRGLTETGTLQFMAIDLLSDVIRYNNQSSQATMGVDSPAMTSTTHELKHDLESLIWVADYALYRRAFERTKGLSPMDPARAGVEEALETDYGQLDARTIRSARRSAYEAAQRGRGELAMEPVWQVLQAIEPILTDIRSVLLTMVAYQDVAPFGEAGVNKYKFAVVMKKHDIGSSMARKRRLITCTLFEDVLRSCLDISYDCLQ